MSVITFGTPDLFGGPAEVTDPAGEMRAFAWDGNGNLISGGDSRGNAWSYAYDALDRLAEARAPR